MGASLGDGEFLSREQQRLTDQLEANLEALRSQNRRLEERQRRLEQEREALEEALRLLAQAAVQDRLAGRPVRLVLPPDAPGEVAERWRSWLQRAGAVVEEPGFEQEAEPALMVAVNPPNNLPILDGQRGVVVWEGQGGDHEHEMVLPSHWFALRSDRDELTGWLAIEGLARGWSGHLKVPASARDLHRVLAPWLTERE